MAVPYPSHASQVLRPECGQMAKQLCVITPAIMGPAYFRNAAAVIGAAAGGPPDRGKMREVFRRHGMTIAAPPGAKGG